MGFAINVVSPVEALEKYKYTIELSQNVKKTGALNRKRKGPDIGPCWTPLSVQQEQKEGKENILAMLKKKKKTFPKRNSLSAASIK